MVKVPSEREIKEILKFSDRYEEGELLKLLKRNFVKLLLLLWEGKAVGYSVMWTFEREAEIHWFEVFKPFRGKGLGKILFGEILNYLKTEGFKKLTLEVSERNLPARRIYESFKPTFLGRREGYYPDGSDALVYLFELEEIS